MPTLERLRAPLRLAATLALATLAPLSTSVAQQTAAATDSAGGRGGGPLATALGAMRFRSIGPAMLSGRILDVAVHPKNKKLWYVAVAAGGVWKTVNAGTTWTPIFDNEASYSIANVVIDQRNPNIVWVGTGEYNAQRAAAYGDGVYKSTDAGRTWQNMGLKQSEHIGKIVIDPRNSDVVYVAAQGPLFGAGGERGLFKTTDGGRSWKKILGDSLKWAGATDIVLDPRNPDVLLAATWQRIRRQWGYVAGGPESALYRSTDAGATWKKIPGAWPADNLGRIGLAIAPANPDVVYAIIEAAATGGGAAPGAPAGGGGFFRSRDGGVSWERMSAYTAVGLYYNRIFPDPNNVDRVYSVDVQNQVTDDAGRTFRAVGERNKHVDNHSIWIDADDSDHLILGCDGGLYESFDRGATYKFFANLPLGQFYKLDVDNAQPFYRVYGGTQDNSSVGGPSRNRTANGIQNAEWYFTQGGDGFQSRVDPKDPNTVYAESQHGNLDRFNLKTGESVSIVPQPEPGQPALKWYWDSPLIISPFLNTRLYFGSNILWRSDDRGDTWRPVSGDMGHGIDRNRLKLMDHVWSIDALGKNTSSSLWGSISAIEESPKKEGLLWIGTDDGLIHVSEDGGRNWRKIEHFAGVPDTTFVAKLTPSSFDVNTVYAAFDNHQSGDYKPYVLKSTDLGRTWTSVAGNLPERGTVYVVIEDHKSANMLFVGTEFGAYVTLDGGQRWTRMRGGLPTIQVHDMAIQKRDDELVLATFGRSFYVFDDLGALRALTPTLLAKDAAILPVKRVPMFVRSNPLGGGGAASQGGAFYLGDNPPAGATISYYLRAAIRTRREARQLAERTAGRGGQDVFYPPWDSVKTEEREEAPAIVLTISDAEGRVVRRLNGPTGAGVQRVTWDLRYPASNPVATPVVAAGGRGGGGAAAPPPDEIAGFGGGAPGGPFIVPGTYKVSMAKRVDGATTPFGDTQTFEVYPLDADSPRSAAVLAFQQKTAQLQRAVLGTNSAAGEAMGRVQALRAALVQTPAATTQMMTQARSLEERLRDIQESLAGDNTAARHSEASPPSLLNRLGEVTGRGWTSTLGEPTNTEKHQYDIVATELGGILEKLRTLVEIDLKRLEDSAEAAGAPWTSGRIPKWTPQGVIRPH